MRSSINYIAFLVALCAAVNSFTVIASSSAVEPDKLIVQLFNEMNSNLRDQKDSIAQDKSQLIVIGERVLGPYVSFELMAKQILGKHWRKITQDQKDRYVQAFKNRVAFTMASQYKPDQDYGLDVKGARYNSAKNRSLVKSTVTNKQTGKKYLIDYKFYLGKKTNIWQVYDVIVEGVSLLQSFKVATDQEINRNGIEAVIAQLETELDKVRKEVVKEPAKLGQSDVKVIIR